MGESEFKVAIIGAGPAGGILGAILAQKNIEVTLVDNWESHIKAIQKSGLQILGVSNQIVHFDDKHLKKSTLELKNSDINLVFICVKAPYLQQVVQDLEKVISDDTYVVIHQNGVGNENIIIEKFGEERSFRNVIYYAGNLIRPGIIDMTFFNPPNYVGALSSKSYDMAKSIAKLMSSFGFQTEYIQDIQREVWKKVIFNAALSPVCAITGQTMKEAMDLKDTRILASEIIKEGIKVAKRVGLVFEDDFYDTCMRNLPKGGHHKPSMLIDVENRNPTEIDFLNGKIVEFAEKFNISAPFNQATVTFVRALESKY